MDRELRRRGGRAEPGPLTALLVEAAAGLPRRPWRGTAVLLFRRCAYFAGPGGELLALAGRGACAAPCGIRLAVEAPVPELGLAAGSSLEQGADGWLVDGRRLAVDAPGVRDEPSTWAPLPRLVPRAPLAGLLAALAPPALDDEWLGLLRAAEALARTSPLAPAATACALALLGRGSGSTPAGDDFLVGWLAGLRRQRQERLPVHGALEAGLSATCRLSRHFIGHALAGRYHAAVVRAASAAILPGPDEPAARALAALGDRSGRAALAGLYAGAYQGA
jgi:uncharacterized protein DUF2877